MGQGIVEINFLPITELDIELTDRCNAKCPMCTRTIGNYKGENDLSFQHIKNVVSSKYTDVKSVILCGNLGDPMIHHDIYDIINFLNNKNISVNVNTNGSIQSERLWSDLGKLKNLVVSFHIDGDENTNHIYRVKTNYNKIIKNAKSYINSGGKAKWVFIPFEHNYHVLNKVKKLSFDLGFQKFEILESFRQELPHIKPVKISEQYEKRSLCKLQERSIFITCEGDVLPCCWQGSDFYENKRLDHNSFPVLDFNINLNKNGFDDIILNYKRVEKNIIDTWKTNRTCFRKCEIQ